MKWRLFVPILVAALLALPGVAKAREASWDLNSKEETAIELERALGACASPVLVFVNIATMPAGTGSYVDDDPLPEGETYCYRVRVANLVAASAWSDPAEWIEPVIPPLKSGDGRVAGVWTFCAPENEGCIFAGTQEVRFGVTGRYVSKLLTNGTPCTDAVFGDPAPSAVKHCDVMGVWTFCAPEYERCSFTGTKEVRFGVTDRYVSRLVTNGTPCTNAVFGDPAPGAVKHCDVVGVWTFCAPENEGCSFKGTREVRFGVNDRYVSRLVRNGTPCTNLVFGDPAPGLVKHCEYR